MDLNQEYAAHQEALMRADMAEKQADKRHHLADAKRIAARISVFQLKLGAAASCAWSMAQVAQT